MRLGVSVRLGVWEAEGMRLGVREAESVRGWGVRLGV